MKSNSVFRLVSATTVAAILFVGRSLTPTTAGLPTAPRPWRSFLVPVLVPLLAAEVRLVHFNGAGKPLAGGADAKGLADAVGQIPRRLLGDPQVPVQFHRRHALERRGEQVDGHGPRLVAEIRALQHGADPHAEPVAAFLLAASPRHRLVVVRSDIERSAVRAPRVTLPPLLLEPQSRRLVVGKRPQEFDDGQPVRYALPGPF